MDCPREGCSGTLHYYNGGFICSNPDCKIVMTLEELENEREGPDV